MHGAARPQMGADLALFITALTFPSVLPYLYVVIIILDRIFFPQLNQRFKSQRQNIREYLSRFPDSHGVHRFSQPFLQRIARRISGLLPPCVAFTATINSGQALPHPQLTWPHLQYGGFESARHHELIYMDSVCPLGYIVADSASGQTAPMTHYTLPTRHPTPQHISRTSCTFALTPDLLPGARDVATSYGSMRVYDWGSEDGKKVLFIHGDTTPAPMLGPVARDLANRGCRVKPSVRLSGLATFPVSYGEEPLS